MRTNKMALAAATATAVALGSLATPAMAAETGVVKVEAGTNTTTTGTANTGTTGKTATGNATVESGSSLKDLDPKEIKDWLSVLTAVLSIIGTVATFAMKYAPQFAPQR